ncbi:transposase [Ferrovum myxofaciens]|uniref:Transposase n=1 Tax=Ferrovum myxofaciens TaxID=416213 RepID=A0A9E6MZ81_9PROT|nr:transposase [Ferrovum myxofaciens]QWY77981.1 MAG: transposase [Ferrovum myxofaciens]
MSLTSSVCLLLSEWISFLLAAVPPRSRRTFVELLIGCMLNPEGWVTRAIGAIRREAHWTTYYKLIERANVSVADLSIQLLQLTQRVFPNELVNLIIDDTLVPRCAKKGPGISVKHDHSHKANRPTFLNSQGWVTLALVVRVRLGSALTIPIRSWLVEESGQRGKLWVARQLIEVGQRECQGSASADRCLVHAQEFDSTLARTEGTHHRSGATGYGTLPASGTRTETPGGRNENTGSDSMQPCWIHCQRRK